MRDVLSTLNNFMASADDELARVHFPSFQGQRMLKSAQERFLNKALNEGVQAVGSSIKSRES